MDFETMRRLRESDPAKFTDIGRSKNKGGVRLAGVNPGGQQVPNARLASEVRAGPPPADDPLARIPGYYETGPSKDPASFNYMPAHKRQSPARTPGTGARRPAPGLNSPSSAGGAAPKGQLAAVYAADDEFNENRMTYTREFAGQKRCSECNKWGVRSQWAPSEWAKEGDVYRHCKQCAPSKMASAGKFALAAQAMATPPPKLKDDRVSSTSTSTLRKSKTDKAVARADAADRKKRSPGGASAKKQSSKLPEIRRSSLFPEGYSVAVQMKSKFREEDAQRAVPPRKPLTLDEFKQTKEYRDVLESDELVARTLAEVRERDERTKREIDELKKKRLEQRRVHVDAVDAIRAEADGKLRGAGPLNLLKSRAAPGGGSSSQTPSPGGSGDRSGMFIGEASSLRKGESPEERADRLAAEEVHARLSAGADPSRGPVYDQTPGRTTTGLPDAVARRQSRGEDSADRSRMEFARKIHAVEAASPNGRESFDAVYQAIESPEVQKKISPPKPPGTSLNSFGGSSSPGANLRPRALDASGGYDSSPDSLNGSSHRSPGRVSFKDEAVTPNTKAALLAKAKNLLAEAKAPEQRKKMNEAVSVWTEASRGMLPALNPLDSRRGILKTPSSGTGSLGLGDSPPKEEYYCARCGVKQADPFANFCGGCGAPLDNSNSLHKAARDGHLPVNKKKTAADDIKLPVGPGGRQLSYRGSIEKEIRRVEAASEKKKYSLKDGSKWKIAQDHYNAGDAFHNAHRLPNYLAATDEHDEIYRDGDDEVFQTANKYGYSLDMYGPQRKTKKRLPRSPQTYHRMHSKAFGTYLYVDRWGDTGAEERVDRVQKSEKRRCSMCGLFGKQIRFSDREWDAAQPKCRSCEVAPRDAFTGPKLPRAKHFMRPTAAHSNFAGALDDDNYSEDNFYADLYGAQNGGGERERDPFDDLPSAGRPKPRPVSAKARPEWNTSVVSKRGFHENKFKSTTGSVNPQWNKSSEVTPATSRKAPVEQLIDFDGAPRSKRDSPGGADGPQSPGAGLWYGSSASTPAKAYQVLVDACKLKEEDCFLYLSKRFGRYSEASRGREARGEALAHFKEFLQKAESKGLVPDWWSEENTAELCRASQMPNSPYYLKLIKFGEPMTTTTEIATRWGLAGTESLRDLHFDIDPAPWAGYRAPTPPDEQYAFKSGETPLDQKIKEVLGKAPSGARKDAAKSHRPKWEYDQPLYDQYGNPISRDEDGDEYYDDDGEYSEGGTFYPYGEDDDGEYSEGGTFYPFEDPYDDYEAASIARVPSEHPDHPAPPPRGPAEPVQIFDDGFIAGMGMKQAPPPPGAPSPDKSPAGKGKNQPPSDADLLQIGIDASTMTAEEKAALGLDGSDPAKAAALAEAIDRLRVESGSSPGAKKPTQGDAAGDGEGKITEWGGEDAEPTSERKKKAAAVWDEISESDEEDDRAEKSGRWKPKAMLIGKNFLEQQLAERTHWEPLKPGFILSGAPPTPPMKSKQAEMARKWRNKTSAKKGGKVDYKEMGVMALLGVGGKGVKRDKRLSTFMAETSSSKGKKGENAGATADEVMKGKAVAGGGGGFKRFGQAVLRQNNAGPVSENYVAEATQSQNQNHVSFADEAGSTPVLDLTAKAAAPLVNNALVLSGRSRWGTYEEDDAYAVAVKSALGDRGVEVRGGHRRGGMNVSVESHRAVVLLGVGGSGADTLGESANFLTDAAWLRSLLEFVRRGGCLVLQGDGEPAERMFSLFGLDWRFSPNGRERADFTWNPVCGATARDGGRHWHGWNGGFRVYNARCALLTGVAASDCVFIRGDAFGNDSSGERGEEEEEEAFAAVAAAAYGDGLVCFVGDDNGEEESVDLVARLATTPRVAGRQ